MELPDAVWTSSVASPSQRWTIPSQMDILNPAIGQVDLSSEENAPFHRNITLFKPILQRQILAQQWNKDDR